MADLESSDPGRGRRTGKSGSVQQSKAELLQAIAARRRAQLLRSSRAPSPPPDEVPDEESEHSESSEASGMSGDDDESFDESSPSGLNHSKTRSNGRRRSAGRQFESNHLADEDDLWCESVVKNSSSVVTAADDLSPVIDQLSIRIKNDVESNLKPKMLEGEFERKPKDTILNLRRRLVKKSTIVDSESDSGSENVASLAPLSPSPSMDYNSADDGDVDSPVFSKAKSKTMQAVVSPKPLSCSSTQLHRSSDADDEHAFAPGLESNIEERSSAAIEPQPQVKLTSAIDSPNESDNTEQLEDMVLIDGGHPAAIETQPQVIPTPAIDSPNESDNTEQQEDMVLIDGGHPAAIETQPQVIPTPAIDSPNESDNTEQQEDMVLIDGGHPAAIETQPQVIPTPAIDSPNESDNTEQQEDMVLIDGGHHAAIEPQPQVQPTPAINPLNESDNTEQQEDLVLVDGSHRFSLRAKTAQMLYLHQRAGIEWFWSLHTKGMGGILGDDMGLGKTMQVAAFLAGLFRTRNIKCALIVAPKTLIAHWVKELKVVGLSRKTKDYSGTSVKAREGALEHVLQVGGILLTTYDMVRCNFKSLRGDFVGRDGYGDTSDDIITWDYIILDEGHLVKNPNTQRAKSLREIPAAHRLILSGTPIQNHLQEMWVLFDFCCPNLLGDRKEFKDKYERQILAGTDKNASDRQKRIGIAVAEELRQKFAPFFLRRLKSDVFPDSDNKEERKLSRKNDLIVWLPLSERQEKLYRAFLNSATAEETLTTGAKVLSAMTVMKKICDHPALLTKRAANDIAEGMEGYLDTEDIQAAEAMTRSLAGMVEEDEGLGAPSCKIDFLMALLENLVAEGHRTLIFAQTKKMLNIIQDEVLDREWVFRRIDGTIKAAEREQYVQEFQSDENIPLFLLTSQVGGLGLTLTGADRVVIVDPAWNPSTDNQSVDRAYRIGQKNNVVVYRLMTCGTIEEKIYRKQVFKGHLMKVATEKKNQMRYFSQGELGEMFKVPELGFRVSVTQQQLHKEHYSQHKIDEGLQGHIEFLEGLGIAGVSHHDLLFTKEAEPLPPAEDQDLKASWEPRNPSYVGQQHRAVSKPESHDWDASHGTGRGILATTGLQSRNVDNENLLTVGLLRSKLEWLYRTLDDEAMPEEATAETWMKIVETENELREAEPLISGSKENIGAQLPFLPDATSPVSTQRSVKPFGPNNNKPIISTLPGKIHTIQDEPLPVQLVETVPKAEPMDLPNGSHVNDSPSSSGLSSGDSPAGTNVENDDVSGTLGLRELRLH
ncbi:hypothetical protein M758_2G034400 [Ceratodon purpureus]|nr:hypothetical protein M758_2G034400 [Ceratodon purpureus]